MLSPMDALPGFQVCESADSFERTWCKNCSLELGFFFLIKIISLFLFYCLFSASLAEFLMFPVLRLAKAKLFFSVLLLFNEVNVLLSTSVGICPPSCLEATPLLPYLTRVPRRLFRITASICALPICPQTPK